MYTKTAQFYDVIYSFIDYKDAVGKIRTFIKQYGHDNYTSLLDVACGTGKHLEHFKEHYTIEGLDIDEGMLDVAKKRLPNTLLHHANIVDFNLGRQFDVITCLCSSIGYMETEELLFAALRNLAKHLTQEGVLLVEPWFKPDTYQAGRLYAFYVDEPQFKISRMSTGTIENKVSVIEMHFLIGENTTPTTIQHIQEVHRLGLFTHEQYVQAFQQAGLEVFSDESGLMQRGLYIGRRSSVNSA